MSDDVPAIVQALGWALSMIVLLGGIALAVRSPKFRLVAEGIWVAAWLGIAVIVPAYYGHAVVAFLMAIPILAYGWLRFGR